MKLASLLETVLMRAGPYGTPKPWPGERSGRKLASLDEADDYAELFESVPAKWPESDLFEIISVLAEWRDSRQACLNLGETPQPTTHEGRLERQAKWGRYSKAEAALMAVANRLDRRFDGGSK